MFDFYTSGGRQDSAYNIKQCRVGVSTSLNEPISMLGEKREDQCMKRFGNLLWYKISQLERIDEIPFETQATISHARLFLKTDYCKPVL